MNDLRTAAQQALEALEAGPDVDPIFAGETITALKAALEQPEQEPKWKLSCGCPSQHGGIPAEWAETTREGEPATAYGVICEQHWYEYRARCPNCASLEAQKTELDRTLALQQQQQSYEREIKTEVEAEREACALDAEWCIQNHLEHLMPERIRARGQA